MQHDTTHRVAVVTGAAVGIGWAISQRLAREGFGLALVDKSDTVLARKAELDELGHPCWAFVADLADAGAIPSLAAAILEQAGRCDVLVNNAGTHLKTPAGQRYRFDEMTLREWNLSIALHMTAPMLLSQAFLPGMKERHWGRIVNISSRAGRTYVVQSSAFYTASKAGTNGLTRAIAGEYAEHGITCNSIAPGRIRTPLTERSADEVKASSLRELPVGRIGEPEEVATAVAFLASDGAAFITGAVIDLNGGGFMAP